MLLDPSDVPTGLIGSESTCGRRLICLLMPQSGVGHYGDNQVDTGPVQAVGSSVGLSTRTALVEQLACRIIKAILKSVADIHAAAVFMKFISKRVPWTAARGGDESGSVW